MFGYLQDPLMIDCFGKNPTEPQVMVKCGKETSYVQKIRSLEIIQNALIDNDIYQYVSGIPLGEEQQAYTEFLLLYMSG